MFCITLSTLVGGGWGVRTNILCKCMSNDAYARIFPKSFVQDCSISLYIISTSCIVYYVYGVCFTKFQPVAS